MSALLLLATMFATVIMLGCGLVLVNDLLERKRHFAADGNTGNGTYVQPSWRGGVRANAAQPTAGKIVWVRAGSSPSRAAVHAGNAHANTPHARAKHGKTAPGNPAHPNRRGAAVGENRS